MQIAKRLHLDTPMGHTESLMERVAGAYIPRSGKEEPMADWDRVWDPP